MNPRKTFCQGCTCQTGQPSPQAIRAVSQMDEWKVDRKIVPEGEIDGCEWFIASKEHDYCFFNYMKTLDEPVPDKEICSLLGIDQRTLEETYQSAIKKLQKLKHTEDMQNFVESVVEMAEASQLDQTVFIPSNFKEEVEKKNTDTTPVDDTPKKRGPKPRKFVSNQMPIHRSGLKPDIFGLYSRSTLERIKKEKAGKK